MKLTYQQQVRKAAITRLTMNKSTTGPERRECFAALDKVVRVGIEPKSEDLRFAQRFATRPIASLGKWHRRVTSRLVVIERGIEAAIEANLTKLVDVLSVKRDRFKEIKAALADAINVRNSRSKFIGKINETKQKGIEEP